MMHQWMRLAAIPVLLGGSTWAQTIFGVAFNGPNSPASLYTLSPVTGAATLVGPTNEATDSGIAFAPDGITLYGVGLTPAGFALLKISPFTGFATPVGFTGLGAPCQDMAFRSDGKLFCYSGGFIFTISTTTGAATFVGDTGGFPLGNALAFSSSNVLYTANERFLQTVNQSTGALTLVTPLFYDPAFGLEPELAA